MARHPQTVWTQDELNVLKARAQSAESDPPTTLDILNINLKNHLARYKRDIDSCRANPDWSCCKHDPHCLDCCELLSKIVLGRDVFGFAMMARIVEDLPKNDPILGDPEVYKELAIEGLIAHCSEANWLLDNAVVGPNNILSGAIGYDVLHDLLNDDQRKACRAKIAQEVKVLADAAKAHDSNSKIGWWWNDWVGNNNPRNYAAIGIAGQALECDGDPGDANPIIQNLNQLATDWQAMASENFKKLKDVHGLIKDGSWHEGIGYMAGTFEYPVAYWLGATRDRTDCETGTKRTGSNDDKTAWLNAVGCYILYAQLPNQPRVHVMTHGDWDWSRPDLLVVLRWAAKRFKDPYAVEAARRWDLVQRRLTRPEFGQHYALEYAAYDPEVQPIDPANSGVSLDLYNEDQESVIMRSSWDCGPDSDAIVVGFKAGVMGGRCNYERIKAVKDNPNPERDGVLNIGHDHVDDLGLWIYGKGGWLLPETVAYNPCTAIKDYYTTQYHNSFLFDGDGQLGDERNVTNNTGSPTCPVAGNATAQPWFFERDASVILHASTDHYAFARGDGKKLYPSKLNIGTLLRTVGLSRENGGFIALQDRVFIGTEGQPGPDLMIEQLFHSMVRQSTENTPPWVKLTSLGPLDPQPPPKTALGVRVVAPSSYAPPPSCTLTSLNYQENMDDDGVYDFVRIGPTARQSNMVYLEVLWPAKAADWDKRPNVQPLEDDNPQRGFSIPLGASKESWIYNLAAESEGLTSAGDLIIQGTGTSTEDKRKDTENIAIRRLDGAGALERVVLLGNGKLIECIDKDKNRIDCSNEQKEKRTLLDLGTNQGVLEVAFSRLPSGKQRADLSGTAEVDNVKFYGPDVSEVRYKGEEVESTLDSGIVTVHRAPSPSVVQG